MALPRSGFRHVCRPWIPFVMRQYSTLLTLSRPHVHAGRQHNASTYNAQADFERQNKHRLGTGFFQTRLSPLSIHSSFQSSAIIHDEEDQPSKTRSSGRIRPGRPRRASVNPGPLTDAATSVNFDTLEPSKPSKSLGSTQSSSPVPSNKSASDPKDGVFDEFNWYWESFPPTAIQKQQSNQFFVNNGKNARLLRSIAHFRLVPESDVPEVAFVGRSNVGKSSLLNAVVNANIKSLLARTSSTPGFTKTMNFYGVGGSNGITIQKQPDGRDKIVGMKGLTIVDMPGYGEGSLSKWGIEIMKYIQSRKQLRRVFVLLDAQHGIKDKDRSLLASLRLAGVSHQVILSKMDKLYIPKAKEVRRFDGKAISKLKSKGTIEGLRKVMQEIKAEIQPPYGGGALGEILGCSSETLVDGKRLGIECVRYAVLKAAGLDEDFKRK